MMNQGFRALGALCKSLALLLLCGHLPATWSIVIVDTPYYAKTDAEGKFSIRDVIPGTYTLRAFHEGLGMWIKKQRVVVTDWGESVSLELKASAKS